MKVAESLKQLNNGEAKGEFNDGLIEVAEEYGLDLARTLTNGVHGFRCSFFYIRIKNHPREPFGTRGYILNPYCIIREIIPNVFP